MSGIVESKKTVEISSMSYQESQVHQYLEELDHLAMLRLNSASSSPETTTAKPCPKFKQCSKCGTLKRRSPSSSCLHEPSSKKPNQNLQQNPINLPQPPLRHCLSEPIYSEEEIPFSESGNVRGSATSSAELGYIQGNPLSPENSKTPTTSSSPSSLLRSISDPTVAATSPPLPPLHGTHSPLSSVHEESPNSKRLRRMKKRMKEMRKWVGEVIEEQDEEDHFSEDQNSKIETEREHQEAVWVEKKDDGLVIQFKCPCGEGYEIFLCENNCYYKLS